MNKVKRVFANLSLKYKFLLFFIFFISLPTIFIGLFIYSQANEAYKTQAKDATQGILDKIEGNLSEIVRATENISAYAIYNEDFRTFMSAPRGDFNEGYYRRSVENIEGYLTFQLFSNDYINSISVQGENGNFINIGEPLSGNETKLKQLAKQKKGGILWSEPYSLKSGWKEKPISILSHSRVINDYNNINEQIGFVTIRLDVEKLRKLIDIPTNFHEQSGVYLTNGEDEVILDVHGGEKSELEQNVLKEIDKITAAFNYSYNGTNYLIVSKQINGVKWNLVALVNESEMAAQLVNIKILIRNMIIILIVFGLIAFIGYYYTEIRRIIELTKTTEQIEKKDFSVKVKADSKDEIGKLGYRFNKMVETIKYHIDMEYKLKIKQKDSELKALQSQIDPHFLYNTLDMIRWKARIEHATETSELIELLSRIFRNTLQTTKLWVSLIEELEFVKSYLQLQKKRMAGSFQYSIYVDSQIENTLIIKQIIQPLVENAIKHGFHGKRDKKLVYIRSYCFNEKLVIDVIDNGNGMTREEFKNAISKSDDHALKNIQERINLAFGQGYGLELRENEDCSGTWVRILLPIIKNETDISFLK